MDAFLDQFAKIPILQKVLGLLGICIALAAVDYFMFYSPIKEEQAQVIEQKTKLEGDLEKKRKIVAELSVFRREKEILEQELAKAVKFLPEQSEIDNLLTRISTSARKAGLQILSFTPMSEVTQDFYAQIPISLALQGSYAELATFFDSLSKMNRIVSVGNFNLSLGSTSQAAKKKAEGGKRQLKSNVTITTYRFLPEKLAAPAAPPTGEASQAPAGAPPAK